MRQQRSRTLGDNEKEEVFALGRLGWPLRRVVSTDPDPLSPGAPALLRTPSRTPTTSSCEPYRELIGNHSRSPEWAPEGGRGGPAGWTSPSAGTAFSLHHWASDGVREARLCRMMESRVPMAISRWSGTGTVIVPDSVRCCITMWLPRCRTSLKPWPQRIWQTSRPDRTRSLATRRFESRHEHLGVKPLRDLRGGG